MTVCKGLVFLSVQHLLRNPMSALFLPMSWVWLPSSPKWITWLHLHREPCVRVCIHSWSVPVDLSTTNTAVVSHHDTPVCIIYLPDYKMGRFRTSVCTPEIQWSRLCPFFSFQNQMLWLLLSEIKFRALPRSVLYGQEAGPTIHIHPSLNHASK